MRIPTYNAGGCCYSRMNFCIWSLGTWKYILGMRSPSRALSFTCLHSYILISLHIIRFGYFHVSGLRNFEILPCISHKKWNISVILSESWSFSKFYMDFCMVVLIEFNSFLYFFFNLLNFDMSFVCTRELYIVSKLIRLDYDNRTKIRIIFYDCDNY